MTRKKFKADVESADKLSILGVSNVRPGESDGEVVFRYAHKQLPSGLDVQMIATAPDEYPKGSGYLVFADCNAQPSITALFQDLQDAVSGAKLAEALMLISKRLGLMLAGSSAADCIDLDSSSDERLVLSKKVVHHIIIDDDDNDDDDIDKADKDHDDDYAGYLGVFDDSESSCSGGDPIAPASRTRRTNGAASTSWARLRQDLAAAHDAGFHVGILESLDRHDAENLGHLFSISLRVRKLGVPEEALEAWEIRPHDYVVLLVKLCGDYAGIDDLSLPKEARQFRIGRCSRPKPTLASAWAAFQSTDRSVVSGHGSRSLAEFSPIYMSSSIDKILNFDLVGLVTARLSGQKTWDGAWGVRYDMFGDGTSTHPSGTEHYNNNITTNTTTTTAATTTNSNSTSSKNNQKEGKRKVNGSNGSKTNVSDTQSPAHAALGGQEDYLISPSASDLLNEDHMLACDGPADMSLLLVAMQLGLRHLVQCAKYCMICNRPVPGTFAAIKPFVCDKLLCLHQYLALGVGPPIEHEIISQPLVVDLLVTYFYTAASRQNTRAWPHGLSLMVPAIGIKTGRPAIAARVDLCKRQMHMSNLSDRARLRVGDWFVIVREVEVPLCTKEYFCRVSRIHVDIVKFDFVVSHCSQQMGNAAASYRKTSWGPDPFRDQIVRWTDPDQDIASCPPAPPKQFGGYPSAKTAKRHAQTKSGLDPAPEPVWPEDTNVVFLASLYPFDTDLGAGQLEASAGASLCRLLHVVPPITTLRKRLLESPGSDIRSLECMPPASLTLLNWIVKSNRSAIVQLDAPPSNENKDRKRTYRNVEPGGRQHQKVVGVDQDIVQFRFAQGTVDKELRFAQELVAKSLVSSNMQHAGASQQQNSVPTLFAWHGSRMHNWHSIIRTGLDFSQTVNGRAYGHGVYMTSDLHVALHYGAMLPDNQRWPNSCLGVEGSVAICEVVNAPQSFLSVQPHFVVDKTDWIQIRYLLVKTSRPVHTQTPNASSATTVVGSNPAVPYLMQDPAYPLKIKPCTPMLATGGTIWRDLANVAIPMSVVPAWRRLHYRAVTAWGTPHAGADVQLKDFQAVTAITRPAAAKLAGARARARARAGVGGGAKEQAASAKELMAAMVSLGQDCGDSESDDIEKIRPTSGNQPRSCKHQRLSDDSDDENLTTARSTRPVKRVALARAASSGPARQPKQRIESLSRPVQAAVATAAVAATTASAPAVDKTKTPFVPGTLDYGSLPLMPNPTWAQPGALRHMCAEMGRLQKLQSTSTLSELGWYVDFDRLNNLFQWIVELHSFDLELPLAQDMVKIRCNSIVAEMRFPASFPMSPPFVRVIRPRFLRFLHGGGGHVTAGGSMCMELLTSTGWNPTFSIDSVLLLVRMALCSTLPVPARLVQGGRAVVGGDYDMDEAVSAYTRVTKLHGWKVPKDIAQTGGTWT